MGANVMCLTSAGGIPLFSRYKGKIDTVPFSTAASLNGVHMYGKSKNIILENAKSKNSTVLWKEFQENIILISIGILNEEIILNNLLDAVFQSMVFIVGLDELKSIKNVERLKRDLRPCYYLIDKLLECLDISDKQINNCDLLNFVESVLCSENHLLQDCLDSYANCINTLYCCITIDGCVAVATEGWWDLSAIEKKLLSFLISSNNNCTSFDTPIFLPEKSASVPLRAVGIRLTGDIWVHALIGAEPDLSTLHRITYQCWIPASQLLQSSQPSTKSMNLHNSILGFLLVDFVVGKYTCDGSLNSKKKDMRSNEILRTFYYQTAYLLEKQDCTEKPIETYWCSEYHKIHALRSVNNILCILYTSTIPTHSMRLITHQALTLLTSDSQYCW